MSSKGAVLQNPLKTKSKESKESNVQHPLAPFTVKELRDAIPDHCFERSLLKSSAYVALDYAVIGAVLFVGHYFNNHISEHTSWPVAILFWNIMWFIQGNVMAGLFVLGHECGHQAFSPWKSVNDAFGWAIHSSLLVPYHSWRITHGNHHKHTSHLGKDQVFVPRTHSHFHEKNLGFFEDIQELPISNVIQLLVVGPLGYPLYLLTNAWGQQYKGKANHFVPDSVIFKPEHKADVTISVIGVLITFSGLVLLGYNYSIDSVIKYYLIPYFWCNFWIFSFTYLQHTDKRVPRFRGEEWNFVRGALATVDLNYGVLAYVHHHIQDSHIAHHLFSRIPHYHAKEATVHLKKILGDYYLEDQTYFAKALWNRWNTCHYVEDEGNIVYYKTMDFENRRKQKSS